MEFTNEELKACYRFASGMTNNHKNNMIMERNNVEVFRDDFRGKLGEVALMKYVGKWPNQYHIVKDIDFGIYPRGEWDETDLIINGKYINVKSVKQGASFLMIEKGRYDANGDYTYFNKNNKKVKIDAYVLMRVTVDPDIKCCRDTCNANLADFMDGREIKAEILGAISHAEFWEKKHFVHKGIKCCFGNLNAICRGVPESELPEKLSGNESKNLILQQDNYILSGNELHHNLQEVL